MNCPSCKGDHFRVVWSRPNKGYPWPIRRRVCDDCGATLITEEKPRKEDGESASTAVG